MKSLMHKNTPRSRFTTLFFFSLPTQVHNTMIFRIYTWSNSVRNELAKCRWKAQLGRALNIEHGRPRTHKRCSLTRDSRFLAQFYRRISNPFVNTFISPFLPPPLFSPSSLWLTYVREKSFATFPSLPSSFSSTFVSDDQIPTSCCKYSELSLHVCSYTATTTCGKNLVTQSTPPDKFNINFRRMKSRARRIRVVLHWCVSVGTQISDKVVKKKTGSAKKKHQLIVNFFFFSEQNSFCFEFYFILKNLWWTYNISRLIIHDPYRVRNLLRAMEIQFVLKCSWITFFFRSNIESDILMVQSIWFRCIDYLVTRDHEVASVEVSDAVGGWGFAILGTDSLKLLPKERAWRLFM